MLQRPAILDWQRNHQAGGMTQGWGAAPSVGQALARLFELEHAEAALLEELAFDESCWLEGDLEGVRLVRVPSRDPARLTCYLSRSPAGLHRPPHVHQGHETVLVLQGGFTEQGSGRHVGAGEVLQREPGASRAETIDPGEDCLCAIRVDFGGREKHGPLDLGLRPPER